MIFVRILKVITISKENQQNKIKFIFRLLNEIILCIIIDNKNNRITYYTIL